MQNATYRPHLQLSHVPVGIAIGRSLTVHQNRENGMCSICASAIFHPNTHSGSNILIRKADIPESCILERARCIV